ncbi:MAG: hypothetical protein KDD35_07980, partial [Bdellovibrionales bacterium]|nr:hypothetical protein [Bdellovibrionales bacterium]
MGRRNLALFILIIGCIKANRANALKIEIQSEGQVLVCLEGNKKNVRLFDFYEEVGRNHQVVFPGNENWAFDKARWAFSQVESYHPELVESLMKKIRLMPGQIVYRELTEISGKEVSHAFGLPKGCRLEKAFYLKLGGEPKYVVREDLWNKMSTDDQAGLILGGLLSEEFMGKTPKLNYGHIRSLVRLWSGGGPKIIGLSRYVNSLEPISELLSQIRIDDVDYRISSDHPLTVYENGKVKSGVLAENGARYLYKSLNGFSLEIGNKRGPVKIDFHATGVPREALLRSEVVEIPIQGKKLKFKHEVSFYPSGMVKRGFFLSEYGLVLAMSQGRFRRFNKMEYYLGFFDQNGKLLSARRLSN